MKSEKEKFMTLALKEADKAEKKEEVPIGCVIVKDGKVVARAHNLKQTKRLATAHAEVLAIEKACRKLKDWRLEDYEIYVTLEPCAMCAGAMVNARVERVVYGMSDPRSGCCGSALDITGFPGMLHQVKVTGGVLELECTEQFKQFFRKVRSGELPKRNRPEIREG